MPPLVRTVHVGPEAIDRIARRACSLQGLPEFQYHLLHAATREAAQRGEVQRLRVARDHEEERAAQRLHVVAHEREQALGMLAQDVVIDARLKPGFPKELSCDPETAALVTRRWSEYFPGRGVEMGDSERAHLD